MCNCGSMKSGWIGLLLDGGRTCFWRMEEYALDGWWKNIVWCVVWLSVAVWWNGRICYWVVEGIWAEISGLSAVGWWKNMPLNVGRICIGWWKNMLLVVEEEAHFGCKFALILKKKTKICELKIFAQMRSFLISFFSFISLLFFQI
ncbi:unnamed protein product [Meloidogyne enterolobii]|uniref:Uncharacterized protein n=1 Tax=Meloidogyne enterolobii TaxID=390850 RepID=A0ACB0ZJV4_MELEN